MRVFVVLGFGTSRNVGAIVSTSYPFTNALPGEIWYIAKSSEGVEPPYVVWSSLKSPLFPSLLLRDSFTLSPKDLT